MECNFFKNSSLIRGGAIYNILSNNLTIDNCIFDGNSGNAALNGVSGEGGAIYNLESDGRIINSIFRNNGAQQKAGAIFNRASNPIIDNCVFEFNEVVFRPQFTYGGAVFNFRSFPIITRSTFRGNYADLGGAIANSEKSSAELTHCILDGNGAIQGGGIFNQDSDCEISFSSILNNNVADFDGSIYRLASIGGGIYNDIGDVTLSNSTISDNKAFNGGGIFNDEGKFVIRSSAIVFNSADSLGGGAFLADSLEAFNSIFALNQSIDSVDFYFSNNSFISQGHNLIGRSTDFQARTSDLIGKSNSPIDPKLGSLATHGGLVPTYELMGDSPAIGLGQAIKTTNILLDQRGYSRIIGSKNDSIDIGPFEYQETHLNNLLTQICENEDKFESVANILLSDSTGGAWPYGLSQKIVIPFPEEVEIYPDSVRVDLNGKGISLLDFWVESNSIHIAYDRFLTIVPNTILISGLWIKPTRSGFYTIQRSGEGNAIQNRNNPLDSAILSRIWVFPSIDNFPYDDSFERDPIWQAENSSSLWQWGEPADTRINTASDGEKVFMTNLSGTYEANSHSWLYSPCTDLSSLRNPTLSFDYWADMESQIDGVVIQYSIDRGASWNTLGSDTTGLGWYNSSAISANPGEQTGSQQYGWTGQTNGWKKAIHRLPDELKIENLRLRLVFRSFDFVNPVDKFNGFAIDNLSISDYQKNVLGELFLQNPQDLSNTYSEIQRQFDDELLTITYPLFAASTEVESRNNFYGRRETNTLILDGQAFYDPPSLVSYPEIDSLSLDESPFQVSFPTDALPLEIMALQSFPQEITVHSVIVEKENVFESEVLQYVVRKFLPTTAGESVLNWQYGETLLFEPFWDSNMIPTPPSQDQLNDYQLIVFLQDANTKRILQAEAFPLFPSLISTNSDEIVEHEDVITIFPNPAVDKIFISLPNFDGKTAEVKIFDLQGKLVETWNRKLIEPINVQHLLNGSYYLKVNYKDKSFSANLIINKG